MRNLKNRVMTRWLPTPQTNSLISVVRPIKAEPLTPPVWPIFIEVPNLNVYRSTPLTDLVFAYQHVVQCKNPYYGSWRAYAHEVDKPGLLATKKNKDPPALFFRKIGAGCRPAPWKKVHDRMDGRSKCKGSAVTFQQSIQITKVKFKEGYK